MSVQKNYPTNLVTGKVRLSYVNLFKPRTDMSGKTKYSVTLLIPKSDTATLGRINDAIQAARQKGLDNAWGGTAPQNLATPMHDGDGVKESGEPYGPECKGHWVMTASSDENHPPQLVDQRRNQIIDQTLLYSGCYAYVYINFYPYGGGTTGYKKGVGVGLGPVQKVADGEPLGGGAPSAESVFGVIEDESVVPTPGNWSANQGVTVQPQAQPVQTFGTTPGAINPITGLPM